MLACHEYKILKIAAVVFPASPDSHMRFHFLIMQGVHTECCTRHEGSRSPVCGAGKGIRSDLITPCHIEDLSSLHTPAPLRGTSRLSPFP